MPAILPSSMNISNNIRCKQTSALRQVLNLNEPVSNSLAVEPVWKVVIFDAHGQDVLSPLLTVKDLRDLGVTLHMKLESARQALPDVPAVYLVSPTPENINIICQDLSSGLYESYYLNFITAVPRPLLEQLATSAVQCDSVNSVNKVFDQYVDFISLEDDLFTLSRHSEGGHEAGYTSISYYDLNQPNMTDTLMDEILDSIVEGLFSVCVSLGVVPIIRCPKGNAAEQVSERLDKKLRDNLRDARNNLFTPEHVRPGQVSLQRPVLIVLDRSLDPATMLHHTWTYQALVHDVLELDLNRVVIKDVENKGTERERVKVKEYDLNSHDKFWGQHKGSPFPCVAEAVQEELEAYRSSEEEIKRLKSAMGLDGEGEGMNEAIGMLGDSTDKLTSTVSSLPDLLEKKRLIDMHTNVATSVLDAIKNRKLDIFFETEEKLLSKQLPDRPVSEILDDEHCGTSEDKLRLLLLQYICATNLTENELKSREEKLQGLGVDTAAVKYIRMWRSLTHFNRDVSSSSGMKTVSTVSMFSKLLDQSSRLVMEGVKNLVIKRHNLPVTAITDSIMDIKADNDTDKYRYFDPKLIRHSENVSRSRSPFNEAIVFLVGGGNYVEYHNLLEYAKSKSSTVPRKITYGCTEIVNATQFLKQLTRLGTEM